MKRFIWRRELMLALSLAALAVAVPAWAVTVTHTQNDIMMSYTDDCTVAPMMVNMGDLSVSVSNAGGNIGLRATFTVDAAISGAGSGDTSIWECVELHWVQLITADACPASVAGVPAGNVALPFPVIDTPPNGWDYIYNDLDAPADGIQADERVNTNTDGAGLVDDANDTLPWYHTLAEEAQAVGSGNETGGLGAFVDCVSYGIIDVPGFCPLGGITAFSTFLVAVPTHNCGMFDCLDTDEMLVLASFDWNWTSNNANLSVGASTIGADEIDMALANTGFEGWAAYDEGSICCPEPSTTMLALVGLATTFIGVRRARRNQPMS